MPYSAEISRTNPSCLVFMIDRSGSMNDPFGVSDDSSESARKKADGVADAINRLIQNLVIKCAKAEGVRDYYHVGVIGYGGTVEYAFAGALAGKPLVPISEVAETPARIEERKKKVDDGAGGLVEQTVKFPIWFDAVARGGTPMSQAFNRAQSVVKDFINQHPDCFPPIVINITDGEATDGKPDIPARELTQLQSSDGNVLLFNLHLSSSPAAPIEFPDSEDTLPDQYAKLLFKMSSELPEYMRTVAQQEGVKATEKTRGFVFNANIVSVIQFLDIGTRPANLR